MELAAVIQNHSVRGYAPSSDHQYQKYSNIKLLDIVSYGVTREKVYKLAATAAKVAGAVLLIQITAAATVGVLAIPGASPVLAGLVLA